MRVPRRTPFYTNALAELAYVHACLYAERESADTVGAGLAVVRLWLNRAACPQAVEVTALLVQAQLVDRADVSAEGARSAYAMALVRFVNSVVDAFQTGMFAQSIAVIAERVGLPHWLVQVRHAATHEALPSVAVCREACGIALSWLDEHYWQQTLCPPRGGDGGSGAQELAEEHERRRSAASDLAQKLHTYRAQALALAADQSLALRTVNPLVRAAADIEAWVDAEAAQRTTAPPALLHRWEEDEEDEEDPHALGVSSALMLLATQLLLPGALIPPGRDARRMGLRSGDAGAPLHALPESHARLWDPLLTQLQQRYPHTLSVVTHAMARTSARAARADQAASACAWLVHLACDHPYVGTKVPEDAPRWPPGDAASFALRPELVDAAPTRNTAAQIPLRNAVVQACVEAPAAACVTMRYSSSPDRTLAVARHVAGDDAQMRRAVDAVAQGGGWGDAHEDRAGVGPGDHASARASPAPPDAVLTEMEERERALQELIQETGHRSTARVDGSVHRTVNEHEKPVHAAAPWTGEATCLPGWHHVEGWVETPIGCLAGEHVPLVLG
ncbi:rRNA-processing protein las1 [Malassezia sp. CBS 17886]|nr:rRNA-processing protein las1 [Malassezia sp. CBS 17886]